MSWQNWRSRESVVARWVPDKSFDGGGYYELKDEWCELDMPDQGGTKRHRGKAWFEKHYRCPRAQALGCLVLGVVTLAAAYWIGWPGCWWLLAGWVFLACLRDVVE